MDALLPFFVVFRLLAPLDASSSSGYGAELQQLANEFNSAASQLLTTIDSAVIDLTRAAYITVILVGVFLYFTRLARRLGRELIIGGIILAVLSEFVFPAISNL